MAQARDIPLGAGLDQAARRLGQTNSLIGNALRLLTDDASNQATLKTSLKTLTRVLDAVHWPTIGRGDPEAWLYFYEHFLEVYDNQLRKQTGSYYTPPQVVGAMVRLVDEALRGPRFGLYRGLASSKVRLADPAVGTGTFLLSVLRRIADWVEKDEGPGAVHAEINEAVGRLIAFEIQLGPFAVAQLRLLAELADLTGAPPTTPPRMFVTDTLGNPYVEQEWIPAMLEPIADSRRQANAIKRNEPIMVVIGNPPYKEKAKGLGGWVESGSPNSPEPAPLQAWMPPREWGVGAHAKHLRNLYVYFWRWATWKVFDHDRNANTGIVCFITVSGFLNGPGFQKMRDYLRRTADDIWVIDCSPEGHQPEVNTRIFRGRPASRLHRTDLPFRGRRPGDAGEGPVPRASRGASGGQVRRLGRRHTRRGGLGGLLVGVARPLPAGVSWGVGDLSRARGTVPLQRIRRDAGPHLGHRPRRGIPAAALADARSGSGRSEGRPVPSAPSRRTAGRQTHHESSGTGAARLRAATDTDRPRARLMCAAGALRVSLLRPSVDYPG